MQQTQAKPVPDAPNAQPPQVNVLPVHQQAMPMPQQAMSMHQPVYQQAIPMQQQYSMPVHQQQAMQPGHAQQYANQQRAMPVPMTQPVPIQMHAQPQVQYVAHMPSKRETLSRFSDHLCVFFSGSCLGGLSIIGIILAVSVDALFVVKHTDWSTGVSLHYEVHCHRDSATVTGPHDFDEDFHYDECEDSELAYNVCTALGECPDDCDVLQQIGSAWLALCIVSIIAGVAGVIAPFVSPNRWAKRIGGSLHIFAAMMAFIAVAQLTGGGSDNVCREHGGLDASPIFVIFFGLLFLGAGGTMIGLAQAVGKPNQKQIPVPLAVPQAQLGMQMAHMQPAPVAQAVSFPEGSNRT